MPNYIVDSCLVSVSPLATHTARPYEDFGWRFYFKGTALHDIAGEKMVVANQSAVKDSESTDEHPTFNVQRSTSNAEDEVGGEAF